MDAWTKVQMWQGAAAITLAAGDLEATFLPEVGMLGASLRHRGDELLVLPLGLAGYRAGHQAGLPLLAPWANRLGSRRYESDGVAVDLAGVDLSTDDNGLCIHGTMTAQSGWRILQVRPGALSARFDYGAHPDLLAAFPFPHELIVDAEVDGTSLSLTTTLRPTTDRTVPVAFGWHPYLHLPGTPRREWKLGLPKSDHIELDERGLPTGRSTTQPAEAAAIGDRTFDDLYALGSDRELAIEGGGRRIAVTYGAGYSHAQVFAPPREGYACLEAMTASTNSLVAGECPLVPPDGVHVAQFSITPSVIN